MALACRICRVPMSATVGCAVCDPMRRNLVVVGEDEEDRPSLSGTASEAVAVLRAQLDQVKGELKRNGTSALHEKRAIAITNALAKIVDVGRKLKQDGAAAVEALSFQERKELFVEWYTDLAPAYRQSVREAFAAYEAEIAKPVAVPEEPVLS